MILPRVLDEKRHVLKGDAFTLVTSNRGGSCVSITPSGHPCITRPVPEILQHGRQSALFCTTDVFGRLVDRKLRFQGEEYSMPYPDDVCADQFDPERLFLHGLAFLYTWEVSSQGPNYISYQLKKERLPKDYPFPHTAWVTYTVTDSGFKVKIQIGETRVLSPMFLAVHPFFKFYLGDDPSKSIQIEANLSQRFDYSADAPLPMGTKAPTTLNDGGPYRTMTKLPADLDHTHISADGVSTIYWEGGPRIQMRDLTSDSMCAVKPLQIWTTAGKTENKCGIEQGGMANGHSLVEDGLIPSNWMMQCPPVSSVVVREVEYVLL